MLSYAQNAEDIVLWRALKGVPNGFYVDVGAHHPTGGSVTKNFYDRGWSGINIEPIPHLLALFKTERPRDVNLNVGIADQRGSMPFWTVVKDPERSTFNRELGEGYVREKREVEVSEIAVEPLHVLLERHVPAGRHIDLLKIDAEGFERQVLESAQLEKWTPSVVTAEHNFYETWEPILFDAGYELALYDGLNRYYFHESRPELRAPLSLPALRSMDRFEPWLHVHQLQQAYARIHELEARVQALEATRTSARARRVAKGLLDKVPLLRELQHRLEP
jgi:FkbM family methyltransferase